MKLLVTLNNMKQKNFLIAAVAYGLVIICMLFKGTVFIPVFVLIALAFALRSLVKDESRFGAITFIIMGVAYFMIIEIGVAGGGS
jgi:hypothetical protein